MKRNAVLSAGIAAAVLLIAGASRLPGQDLRILKLPRETIEGRLRDCPARNGDRWPKLAALFKAAGTAEAQIRGQAVPGFADPNIICTLPGTGPSKIIVGAHFDNVGNGHGVIDNWSGAALLPSLFESLKVVPRRHTFIFAAFAAEEAGLKGSNAYARSMTEGDISRTRALVNLDCLGLGTTAVMPRTASKPLMDALLRVAGSVRLQVRGYNRTGYRWDTDSFSPGIPKITLHSLSPRTREVPNSFRDNSDAVCWEAYYDTYYLLALYLAHLDAGGE